MQRLIQHLSTPKALTKTSFGRVLTIFFSISCLPQPSLSQTQELGLVTSRPCPYSCATRGLPKTVCRDWREGDTCYVEDLTKPAAGSNTVGSDGDPLGLDAIAPREGAPRDGALHDSRKTHTTHTRGSSEDCEGLARDEIAPPRINVSRDRDAGSYRNQETIRGSVEGVCIQEAGYFEDGKKVSSFDTEASREFQRFEFEVRIRKDRYPELRAYNTAGESFILQLDKGHDSGSQDSPPKPRNNLGGIGANRF